MHRPELHLLLKWQNTSFNPQYDDKAITTDSWQPIKPHSQGNPIRPGTPEWTEAIQYMGFYYIGMRLYSKQSINGYVEFIHIIQLLPR